MLRTWLTLVIIPALVSVCVAQETAPDAVVPAKAIGPDANSEIAGPLPKRRPYLVQMRVLEGKRLFSDGSAAVRDLNNQSWPDVGTRTADRKPIDAAMWYTARPVPVERSIAPPDVAPHPVERSIVPSAVAPHPIARETNRTAKPDNSYLREGMPRDSDVTELSAPQVVTAAGRTTTVAIQTGAVFDYLVPLGNGKFEVKHTQAHTLGMTFTLSVQPSELDDQSVELAPLEVKMTTLDGREPVEGLNLEVGKPIIATRSLNTTARLRRGETRLIAIPSGPSTQAALILRIKPWDAQQEKK